MNAFQEVGDVGERVTRDWNLQQQTDRGEDVPVRELGSQTPVDRKRELRIHIRKLNAISSQEIITI